MSNDIAPLDLSTLKHQSFKELWKGFNWAAGITNKVAVQPSHLRTNFFDSFRPRDVYFRLLGVQKGIENTVAKIEPDGEWRIEVELPGTEYTQVGILTNHVVTTQMVRFSAWYSRFLPYAVGMLKGEWRFPDATGIDFESINSYYGTCMGFVYLGQGDGNEYAGKPGEPQKPVYERIITADVDLFNECKEASDKVRSPSLPFEEAHWPCLVYVALHKPNIITRMVDSDHWWCDHVNKCCEIMGKPRPKWKKTRKAKAA